MKNNKLEPIVHRLEHLSGLLEVLCQAHGEVSHSGMESVLDLANTTAFELLLEVRQMAAND